MTDKTMGSPTLAMVQPADGQATNSNKKPASMRRVATASLVGTTIEFYDFFIYGTAAALVFPTVFFPNMTPLLSTVASFATFGVAFLARPLGSIVFGHFGDVLGRKRTLVWTLLLMGIATILIGLLPGYQTGVLGLFESGIGVWGPVLLVALRFLQGMAVGGEWAGAVLLTAEYAPPGKRGLYGMFPQLGASVAFFLSSGTFLAVSMVAGETSEAFLGWGWRLPFLISIIMVAVGLYVRLVIEETPSFEKERKRREAAGEHVNTRRFPFMDTLKYQWKEAVIGGISLASLFSLFYMGTSYLTNYGTKALGHSFASVLAVGMAGALIFGVSYGPAGHMLPELFRVDLRYTGAGLAYNIAAILGGAIPPLAAAPLQEQYGGIGVGLMLAFVSFCSTIAITRIRTDHHKHID